MENQEQSKETTKIAGSANPTEAPTKGGGTGAEATTFTEAEIIQLKKELEQAKKLQGQVDSEAIKAKSEFEARDKFWKGIIVGFILALILSSLFHFGCDIIESYFGWEWTPAICFPDPPMP